jgi:hypothetical protein
MMAFLRRALHAEPEPITHMNIKPAERDHEREQEIRDIHAAMASTRVRIDRTSAEIRQELAGNVLRIVAGD